MALKHTPFLTGTDAELAQLEVAFSVLSIGVPTLRHAALLACTLGAAAGLLDGEPTLPILFASTMVTASSMISSSQAGSLLAPLKEEQTKSPNQLRVGANYDSLTGTTDMEIQARTEPTMLDLWEKKYGLQVPPSGNPVEWSVDEVAKALNAQVTIVHAFRASILLSLYVRMRVCWGCARCVG